jgi:hypothetical protein
MRFRLARISFLNQLWKWLRRLFAKLPPPSATPLIWIIFAAAATTSATSTHRERKVGLLRRYSQQVVHKGTPGNQIRGKLKDLFSVLRLTGMIRKQKHDKEQVKVSDAVGPRVLIGAMRFAKIGCDTHLFLQIQSSV